LVFPVRLHDVLPSVLCVMLTMSRLFVAFSSFGGPSTSKTLTMLRFDTARDVPIRVSKMLIYVIVKLLCTDQFT
jgi:hypothetical protein